MWSGLIRNHGHLSQLDEPLCTLGFVEILESLHSLGQSRWRVVLVENDQVVFVLCASNSSVQYVCQSLVE